MREVAFKVIYNTMYFVSFPCMRQKYLQGYNFFKVAYQAMQGYKTNQRDDFSVGSGLKSSVQDNACTSIAHLSVQSSVLQAIISPYLDMSRLYVSRTLGHWVSGNARKGWSVLVSLFFCSHIIFLLRQCYQSSCQTTRCILLEIKPLQSSAASDLVYVRYWHIILEIPVSAALFPDVHMEARTFYYKGAQ